MNKIFTGIIFFISSEIVYARSPDDLQQLPDFGNLNVIIYGLSIAAVIMATTTTFSNQRKTNNCAFLRNRGFANFIDTNRLLSFMVHFHLHTCHEYIFIEKQRLKQ